MTRKSLLVLAVAGLLIPSAALAQRCPGDRLGPGEQLPMPAVIGYAVTTADSAAPAVAPSALPAVPPQVRVVGGAEGAGTLLFTVRFAEQIFAECRLGFSLFDRRFPPASGAAANLGQLADLNLNGASALTGGEADGSDIVRFAVQTGRSALPNRLDFLVFQLKGRTETHPFVANLDSVTLGAVTLNRPSLSFGDDVVVRAETPTPIATGLGNGAPGVTYTIEPASSALTLGPGVAVTTFTPGFRPARAERTLKGGFVRTPTTVNIVATVGRQRTTVPVQVLPWSCQPDVEFRAEPGHVVVAMGNSGTAGCPSMTARLTGVATTQAVPVVAAGTKPAFPAAAAPVLKPATTLSTNRLRPALARAIPASPSGWVGRFAVSPSVLTTGGMTLTLTPIGGDAIPIAWRPTLAEQATLRTAPPK